MEILTVIAALGVLSALVFGLAGGVQTRAEASKTRGELAVLAVALEQYKARWGDYPFTTGDPIADNTRLYRALLGTLPPDGDATKMPHRIQEQPNFDPRPFTIAEAGTPFAVVQTLTSTTLPSGAILLDPNAARHVLLDAFGVPYVYLYKEAADDSTWQRRGYLLVSLGASGGRQLAAGDGLEAHGVPASGLIPANYRADAAQADNLFAHE